MKVVRLSAIFTGRLYPLAIIPGTHLCQRPSQSKGHSAAGRIMSVKNSSDTIGNQTRDLPACSIVPQPTVPPCTPFLSVEASLSVPSSGLPAPSFHLVFLMLWYLVFIFELSSGQPVIIC
jgi:hypothetical protein